MKELDMAASMSKNMDSVGDLDLNDIGVLRFTSDSLVSQPERYDAVIKRAEQRPGQASQALETAFEALRTEFAGAQKPLDRSRIREIAVRLIGDAKPRLRTQLAPRPMAGYALLWSLGEPPADR
jgi:hypothetical protein